MHGISTDISACLSGVHVFCWFAFFVKCTINLYFCLQFLPITAAYFKCIPALYVSILHFYWLIYRATRWAILWESAMALCCVCCHPLWVENIQMDGMEIFGWEPIWNVKQGLQEMSRHPAALSPQFSQISEFRVQGEIHGSGAGVEIIHNQMGPPVRLLTLRNVKVSQKGMELVNVCYFFI